MLRINRNFKLGLGGLGFLGFNGALVPVLNGNLSFPDISFSTLGGGSLYKSEFIKKEHESPKLKLDDAKSTKTSLELDIQKVNLPSPKLDLQDQTESSLTLNFESVVGQNSINVSSSIGGIHTEIGREGRVSNINQQLERQLSDLSKQHLQSNQEKHVKNFEDAKRQVIGRSRARRSSGTTESTLTSQQRDSIQKMFSLYHGLKKESKNLSSQLEAEFFNGLRDQLGSVSPTALAQVGYSEEDIVNSLKEIGWTSKSITTQKSNRGRRDVSNSQSWGSWSANPFRHFYSREEDFKSAVQQLQSNAERVNEFKRNQEFIQRTSRDIWSGSSRNWPLLSAQFKETNRRISEWEASQDSHIVNKIASKLFEYMGQGSTSV